MPENKQEIKKLVKEEFKKQGVEAPAEVVEQVAKAAGCDLDGVSGGMNATGRVALAVGGAIAAAGAGALVAVGVGKAYDKYKGRVTISKDAADGIDENLLELGRVRSAFGTPGGIEALNKEGKVIEVPGAESYRIRVEKDGE